MSDFGQMCPLFTTGVFKELTFPYISMTAVSASSNALIGTHTLDSAAWVGHFTFGRTVVVTGAFVRRIDTSTGIILHLQHHVSRTSDRTVFGTITFSTSSVRVGPQAWTAMDVTAKTFTSTEVLGFGVAAGEDTSAGIYDLMIRYKEK